MPGQDKLAFEAGEEAAASEAAAQVMKKGVKLSNARSRYSKQAEQKQQFTEAADATIAGEMDRKARAVKLVNNFWRITNDTILVENKGPTHASVETQLVKELVEFATEMNNDPNEPEGAGSVAVITLLLKTILRFRDNQNTLAYKIHNLEKSVSKLSSEVEPSSDHGKS